MLPNNIWKSIKIKNNQYLENHRKSQVTFISVTARNGFEIKYIIYIKMSIEMI